MIKSTTRMGGYCLITLPVAYLCHADVKERWQMVPTGSTMQPLPVFDETRGNWYYKREYYHKARDTYEQIHKEIEEIEKLKNSFFQKRSDSDMQVSQFNLSLGFEQGEVDAILTNLSKSFELDRARMVELTEQQRKMLEEVKEKRKALEQLKKDLATVVAFDNALNKSMGTVLESVSKARSDEHKAWQAYDQIAQVLNDRKAEQLYMEMRAYADHIAATADYLRGKLTQFFDTTIQQLTTHMDKVRDEVAQLKKRGVAIAKKLETSERRDIKSQEKEIEKLRISLLEEQKKEKKLLEQKKNISWWQRLKNKTRAGLAFCYHKARHVYHWVTSFFVRSHSGESSTTPPKKSA